MTIARRRPRRKHQEKIVHPVIMRQLAADHIAELHAKAKMDAWPARPGGPGVVRRPCD